jgi:hypothetical protein
MSAGLQLRYIFLRFNCGQKEVEGGAMTHVAINIQASANLTNEGTNLRNA